MWIVEAVKFLCKQSTLKLEAEEKRPTLYVAESGSKKYSTVSTSLSVTFFSKLQKSQSFLLYFLVGK